MLGLKSTCASRLPTQTAAGDRIGWSTVDWVGSSPYYLYTWAFAKVERITRARPGARSNLASGIPRPTAPALPVLEFVIRRHLYTGDVLACNSCTLPCRKWTGKERSSHNYLQVGSTPYRSRKRPTALNCTQMPPPVTPSTSLWVPLVGCRLRFSPSGRDSRSSSGLPIAHFAHKKLPHYYLGGC